MPAPDSYRLDPGALASRWTGEMQPLAFVDLTLVDPCAPVQLPPFPVIGLGSPGHPGAARLDAIVEAPVSIDTLVANVTGHAIPAAMLVQLLRNIEGLPVDRALWMESVCYGVLQAGADHSEWLASRPATRDAALEGRVVVSRAGDRLNILIDHASARNAIDRAIRDELYEAFSLAALDPEIASVSLRSTGRAFSVGAELGEFGTTRDPAMAHWIRTRTLPAHPLSLRPEIVDVHVQGACVGSGLEMAAFAGRITASRSAWFQLPELAMGVIPGAGGCVSVSRRIGRQRAALMILSGKRIDATTALDWGLVDAIVDEAPVDPGRADGD
jgi:enoyl-CoA hydratase